jgi:hypothetical protein
MQEKDFNDDTHTAVDHGDNAKFNGNGDVNASLDTGDAAPANVPAQQTIDPYALYVRNEGGGGVFFDGDYLNFNGQTGVWSRGSNKKPIGATVSFLCNMHEIYIGWIRFAENEKTRREIGRIIDGYQRLPREVLGDNDKRDWPLDQRGEPKDPWSMEAYLPMRCMQDDEAVVYGPFSETARKAVADFTAIYRRRDRAGKFPIVLLESRSFKNQSGGLTYVPDFKIVGWQYWNGEPAPEVQPVALPTAPSPPKAITACGDMDDEIPF